MRKPSKAVVAAAFAVATGVSVPAHAVSFTAFDFTSNVSTSGAFGGVNGIYGNGDVRLDSITFDGYALTQAQLQTASAATIIVDDGRDAARGGNNLAAGRGINSVADTWTTEGPATITPTSTDIHGALANFNLTSIVVTRETNGIAIVDVSFANPTDRFFFWERGFNSDILVQALNENDQAIGSYTILRSNYAQTGIVITTDNGSFLNNGQALGSIGLQTDEAVSKLRLASFRTDVLNYNGPDYKVLATAGPLAPVPEPSTYLLMLAGLGLVGGLVHRRRAS
ncbi:MAG: PEP-CTERM sorting domain-containing protein [Burkholderiales bacterium]|nr:PEP-CTERM sorting domain-containing protein [Burkholderiales bacterium]